MHLITQSLKGSHVSLSEIGTVLNEVQIAEILQKLLQMVNSVHKSGLTVCNLHPWNVFIDENYPEDVLVTDVGFALVPQMMHHS